MKHNLIRSDKTIWKTYPTAIAKDMDGYLLSLLAPTHMAPTICSQRPLALELEYLDAPTFLSFLVGASLDAQGLELALGRFLSWLDQFQAITHQTLGTYIRLTDFHFENFLYNGVTIYGLDFEQWEQGTLADNYISLLSWLCLYDTANQPLLQQGFEQLLPAVAQRLGLDQATVQTLAQQEIQRIHTRRTSRKKRTQTTAVLMAGGASSRMGTPKAHLPIGRYCFAECLLYTLRQFDQCFISANEGFTEFGLPIIPDKVQNIGPLGGIYTALQTADTPYVLVVPCDCPLLSLEMIEALFSGLEQGCSCVLSVMGGRINPLFAIYKKTLLPTIEAQIKTGHYSVLRCCAQAAYVPIEIDSALVNINTPEAYEALLVMDTQSCLPYTTFLEKGLWP
ncbi:molybdenum cofactor guanylyltransferase [Bengtsoniella intestinalis]|uniref:molybdenum cofactor guanylyltransferase n=1 Tax=Bengtsoniella intestinalis TaxID=3073143 RepID=UPI00391F04A0